MGQRRPPQECVPRQRHLILVSLGLLRWVSKAHSDRLTRQSAVVTSISDSVTDIPNGASLGWGWGLILAPVSRALMARKAQGGSHVVCDSRG